jgi:microcystin-dependent protein
MDYSSQFGLSLTGGDKNDEIDDQITVIKLEINALILSLSDESKARSDEDDLLDGRIIAESKARSDEDDLLDGRIIAESKSRSDEDDLLDGRIIAESKARSDEDDLLDGRIIAESKSRSDEDDLLDGRIIAESKSRSDEDDLLDGRIIAESKARSDEDILINGRITTERGERIFADLSLDFRLDTIEAEIEALDEVITGGDHIVSITNDITTLKANTSNAFIRYTENDDNLIIGTIDNGVETNQIRYNTDVGAFNLLEPNASIVLNDTTNTTSRWQITTTAGKTIFNYIASSGVVDTIFTINSNGNIELNNVITTQGNLNNILANNSSSINGLQSAVSALQQLQQDLQDELNSSTQDSDGNPVLGIVGTIFGVGNTLSIGVIALQVATNTTAIAALATASGLESLSDTVNETRTLFTTIQNAFNNIFSNGYTKMTIQTIEMSGSEILNVSNLKFKENIGGTIQHLTTINDVLLLDASDNEIPQSLTVACETTFGNEIIYKTETLDNRFVNQTDYADNNTAITNNSQQLADNITAIATNITVIDANNIATNASIDANLISVNASIDANLISVNASIDANLISVNASIDANDVATIALIDAIDIRVSTNTTNLASKATTAYVDTAVANIVNGSPALLDTLSELATALGNNPDFANEVLALIATNTSGLETTNQAVALNTTKVGITTAQATQISTNTTNISNNTLSIVANNNLRIDGDLLKFNKTGSIFGNQETRFQLNTTLMNGNLGFGSANFENIVRQFTTEAEARDYYGAREYSLFRQANSDYINSGDNGRQGTTHSIKFGYNNNYYNPYSDGAFAPTSHSMVFGVSNIAEGDNYLEPIEKMRINPNEIITSVNLIVNGSANINSALTVTNPAEINYKNQTLDNRFLRLTGGTVSGNLSATSFNTNNNTNGLNVNSDNNGNTAIGPQFTRNYLTNLLGTEFRTFSNGVYNTTATIFSDGIDFFKNVTMSITNTFNLIPAGTIIMSVRNSTTLSGYLYCNGAQYVSTIYPNLFSVIGTTYGGAQTGQPGTFVFNVPNFQGAFLRGQGSQSFNGVTYSGSGTQAQADQVLTPNTPTVTNRGYFNVPAGSTRSVISRAIIPSLAADSNTGIVVNVSFPRQGTENRPFNYSVKYFIRI